jgi:hypothetical protein
MPGLSGPLQRFIGIMPTGTADGLDLDQRRCSFLVRRS